MVGIKLPRWRNETRFYCTTELKINSCHSHGTHAKFPWSVRPAACMITSRALQAATEGVYLRKTRCLIVPAPESRVAVIHSVAHTAQLRDVILVCLEPAKSTTLSYDNLYPTCWCRQVVADHAAMLSFAGRRCSYIVRLWFPRLGSGVCRG